MPLYEYECEACGHRFEVIQKFSDAPLDSCPKCSGTVRKRQSAPAIQFKGTGWYITDYAKKDSSPAGSAASGSNDPKESKESKAESADSAKSSDSGGTSGKTEKPSESSKTEKPPAPGAPGSKT